MELPRTWPAIWHRSIVPLGLQRAFGPLRAGRQIASVGRDWQIPWPSTRTAAGIVAERLDVTLTQSGVTYEAVVS